MVAGGGFRRCSVTGDVKHLGRKGLIFLGFLELFFHFQHFLVISSTPLSFLSSAGELWDFSGEGDVFPAKEVVVKASDSSLALFVISSCYNFISHLPFPSSCSSSASHLRADSGEFWTAAGSSEAPSCVLELCKLDLCLV